VRILCSLAIAALVFSTGCNDNFGPTDWSAAPDTVDLFSLSRADYQGLPAGYDILSGRHGQRVAIETPGASGNWDFALIEADGQLMLMPAGALRDLSNGAAIGLLEGETFESVTKVPGDPSRYQDSVAVPLEAGHAYAVRSRHYYAYGGQACSLYGKLSPISIDLAKGELRFEVVRNPNCNDRSMIPPKSKK
jgi:hypothetical protein